MALEFPYASSVMLFGIPPSKAIQQTPGTRVPEKAGPVVQSQGSGKNYDTAAVKSLEAYYVI